MNLTEIVRSVLAVGLVGALVYLMVTHSEVTTEFLGLVVMVLGFYFGLDRLAPVFKKGIEKIQNGRKNGG